MTRKRDPLEGGKSYVDRLAREAKAKESEDSRLRPMTYRIGEEIINRINEVAERKNVQKQGLVRALLTYSLDALEAGEWELPIAEEGKRKLDI